MSLWNGPFHLSSSPSPAGFRDHCACVWLVRSLKHLGKTICFFHHRSKMAFYCSSCLNLTILFLCLYFVSFFLCLHFVCLVSFFFGGRGGQFKPWGAAATKAPPWIRAWPLVCVLLVPVEGFYPKCCTIHWKHTTLLPTTDWALLTLFLYTPVQYSSSDFFYNISKQSLFTNLLV